MGTSKALFSLRSSSSPPPAVVALPAGRGDRDPRRAARSRSAAGAGLTETGFSVRRRSNPPPAAGRRHLGGPGAVDAPQPQHPGRLSGSVVYRRASRGVRCSTGVKPARHASTSHPGAEVVSPFCGTSSVPQSPATARRTPRYSSAPADDSSGSAESYRRGRPARGAAPRGRPCSRAGSCAKFPSSSLRASRRREGR